MFIAVPAFLVDGIEVLIRREFPNEKFNAADFVRWLILMHLTPDDLRAIEQDAPQLGFRFRFRQWVEAQRAAGEQ